jgi:hypothetical protein
MFPSHISRRCTNLETFFLAIFPDGGKTSKHCFQTMFPEDRKPEHCFLVMFSEAGQTWKHCFLAMFPEGGQTSKHCFLAMCPERGQTGKYCFHIN